MRELNTGFTAAILDPADSEIPVSDEKKAIFYAAAELNVRCLPSELELIH
jgi:hypothetical protein